MIAGVFLIGGLAPGMFWLWFFLRYDRFRPAPRRLIAFTFFLGALVIIPVGIVEFFPLRDLDVTGNVELATFTVLMLLVVGPVEELGKFIAVRFVAYRSLYFEEPMDGLVYSAASSLGFATVENIGYMATFGAAVILVRGPLSTVAHVVFSSFWGYALGRRTGETPGGTVPVVAGLLAAALAHAAFNVALFVQPAVAGLLLLAGGVWTVSRFRWAQHMSPFRYRRNYPLVRCVYCQGFTRVTSSFCQACGSPVREKDPMLFCGNCRTRNRPDAGFCTSCGDRLLT